MAMHGSVGEFDPTREDWTTYQGRRKGGAGGARAPPIFLKEVQSTPNIYRMSAEHPLIIFLHQ